MHTYQDRRQAVSLSTLAVERERRARKGRRLGYIALALLLFIVGNAVYQTAVDMKESVASAVEARTSRINAASGF